MAILGPDELAAGQVKVRNMQTHEERTVDIAALKASLVRFSGEAYGEAAGVLEAVLEKLDTE